MEGYNYCTSNWQVDDSLFTSDPSRGLRRLQDSGEYTAPVIPEVIPADVEEVHCVFILRVPARQFRVIHLASLGPCSVDGSSSYKKTNQISQDNPVVLAARSSPSHAQAFEVLLPHAPLILRRGQIG